MGLVGNAADARAFVVVNECIAVGAESGRRRSFSAANSALVGFRRLAVRRQDRQPPAVAISDANV